MGTVDCAKSLGRCGRDGRECWQRCNPGRLKATQISPLTALRGTNGRQQQETSTRLQKCYSGWANTHGLKPLSHFVHTFFSEQMCEPAFIEVNPTRAFNSTTTTRSRLKNYWSLCNNTETRGKLFLRSPKASQTVINTLVNRVTEQI